MKPNLINNLPSRRKFLYTSGLLALGLNMPELVFGRNMERIKMGIVVHSYGIRWQNKHESSNYPGFKNALELLEHCHTIGAGGIQVGVQNWSLDLAQNLKKKSTDFDMYIEGSIGLPREGTDQFEKQIEIAKEAGVNIFRTVCLGGRRYENFNSLADFEAFKLNSLKALKEAVKIAEKYQVKLAIENHKDWRARELVRIIQWLDNEWAGVTLDFGNNLSLLEDPDEVIELLAPYTFSTHIKDMALSPYESGFLLSEIPLGAGVVDLEKAVSLCLKYNPKVKFNLEMITRDPLKIPCLEEKYWATFDNLPGKDLAKTLRLVRDQSFPSSLPAISHLSPEEQLAEEENNILSSLNHSRKALKMIH